MTLVQIVLATLAGGLLSVALAALLGLTWLPRFADRMVAYAVGLMLATAFMGLLPEAIHLGLEAEQSGLVLLGGLLAFFLLEKLALWRHDHAQGGHASVAHAIDSAAKPQVSLIVLGDGLHNAVDGVLIAAAFLSEPALGWGTAVAVLAHEIPQELGDFMVLLSAGVTRGRALALNALSGAAMVVGGVLGHAALQNAKAALPYVLVLSAASFVYIAIADLIPELHRRRGPRDVLAQAALLIGGLVTVQGLHHMAGH
ncbi:MAG TPA: ZIP family metal transporter [Ramlibacter sp.]|jgi:zinc and cadmium transporter|uniref:ZIP family metal transporter n=1 Tax=Ramlibacter sp. TaxID=1917967 RepID=UPI002D53936B|nr:ZIP family metal transporter [Ramlibacter sp.]HZY19190.1 ZIP family metal transporter [Ramlibacter sp.]